MANKKEEPKNLDDLKKSLISILAHYKFGRKIDVIGMLFRNRELVNKKIELLQSTIDQVEKFTGTKEELLEILKTKRIEHAKLSRDNGKNHFNLDDAGATTWVKLPLWGDTYQRRNKKAGPGELRNSSDVAGILHEVIAMTESSDANIFTTRSQTAAPQQ